MFTPEQVLFYRDNGYLKIEHWLPAANLDSISRLMSLLASAHPRLLVAEKSRTDEGKMLPFQLRGFVRESAWFKEWLSDDKLNDGLSQLVGEKCNLLIESFKLKYPGGGDFHPHQDMQGPVIKFLNSTAAEQLSPKITRLITLCIAFDEHTPLNGCIEIAPGKHRNGWLGNSGENLGSSAVAQLAFEPVTMKPGDAIFFDGFLPHRSAINNSMGRRRALFLFFNPESEGSHHDRVLKFYGLQ